MSSRVRSRGRGVRGITSLHLKIKNHYLSPRSLCLELYIPLRVCAHWNSMPPLLWKPFRNSAHHLFIFQCPLRNSNFFELLPFCPMQYAFLRFNFGRNFRGTIKFINCILHYFTRCVRDIFSLHDSINTIL